MPARPCLDCGRPTGPGTRCGECATRDERDRSRARGRRAHYGGDYAARAAKVRAAATVCWVCGQGARPDDPWQADHVTPADPASALLPAHRSCNIARSRQRKIDMDGPGMTPGWV